MGQVYSPGMQGSAGEVEASLCLLYGKLSFNEIKVRPFIPSIHLIPDNGKSA